MKKIMLVAVALMMVSSLGFAQSLGLHEVGGGLGYVSASVTGSSTESVGGFVFAAHANLGEVSKGITLFPEIQYWSASKDISGGTWKVSDFAINANIHYDLEMEGAVKPYVGAGLGFNSFSFDYTIPGATFFGFGGTYSVTATRIGINLLAGANYKMNDQMSLFLEPRYVLASDFNHFQIKVGATFAMK